jgi:hypothetical protein
MRVFFFNEYDYLSQIRIRLQFEEGVILAKLFTNNKIWYLHTSIRLNKILNLPFKKYWYKKYFDVKNKEDIDYVYFSEYVSPAYDKNYLNYLRKNYPKAKLVFNLSNPINDENHKYVHSLLKEFDHVISFDDKDVMNYGFTYYNGLYEPDLSIKKNENSCDIFFAGRGKNRLDFVHAIYQHLSRNNIKCEFYLYDVPLEKQLENTNIHYNTWLPYNILLQRVANSNVVLEILQDNQSGFSMRTCEALSYKKRLITNNSDIIKQPFYDPKYIRVVNSIDDFDISSIKSEYTPEYKEFDLSTKRFIAFLDNLCKTM